MTMKSISIFGLGYVGCIGVGCFAKLGNKVIGCDVNRHKVSCIANGKPTVVEREIDKIIAEEFAAGRISATTSVEDAVLNSDISFICVGTPVDELGGLSLKYIESIIASIGQALRKKDSFHIIVIRSTVPPGTNEEMGKKIETISGKKLHHDFAMVSNPEFLREGKAVGDFFNPPMTVIGCDDANARKEMHSVYAPLNSEIVEVAPRIAEMIKFVNNSYHALKVAFGNEVGSICKQLGIDSHELMRLFCKDTQLNISSVYFMPGFAYGGSCLPKDLKGLNHLAQTNHVEVPILSAIELSNQSHIERVVNFILTNNKKKVGLVGLTFKAGTDDLRNSASVLLASKLLNSGISLKIYDKFLNIALNHGEDIASRLPTGIDELLQESVEQIVSDSELVVITVKNPELPNLIRQNPQVLFLDLVRVKDDSVMKLSNYQGFCW